MSLKTCAIAPVLGAGEAGMISGEAALRQRISIILNTAPGQVPWRPEFGCRLWSLMGQPTTAQHLAEVRWSIEDALSRWLRGAQLEECKIHLLPRGMGSWAGLQSAELSPAEVGLLHLGSEVTLRVELLIRTRAGRLRTHVHLS